MSEWMYLPLAAVAVAGVWLIWWGVWRDRARGRRRCRACWYDMAGVPSLTCPECGLAARDEGELGRTCRRWWAAGPGVVMVGLLVGFFGVRDGARLWYMLPPKWVVVERLPVGSVAATRYQRRSPYAQGERVLITCGAQIVLDVEGMDVQLGEGDYIPWAHQEPRVGIGSDLDGDGVPELLVFRRLGGRSPSVTTYVIECSDPPIIAAVIPDLVQVYQTGILENGPWVIKVCQRAVYERFSPPREWLNWGVPYRLRRHRLEVALEGVSRWKETYALLPTKSNGQIFGAAGRVGVTVDPDHLAMMLDLLCSGDPDECWKILDAIWPASQSGKNEFKKELLEVLESTAQWRDIQAARAAVAKGEPIPAAIVGQFRPQSPGAPPTKASPGGP